MLGDQELVGRLSGLDEAEHSHPWSCSTIGPSCRIEPGTRSMADNVLFALIFPSRRPRRIHHYGEVSVKPVPVTSPPGQPRGSHRSITGTETPCTGEGGLDGAGSSAG